MESLWWVIRWTYKGDMWKCFWSQHLWSPIDVAGWVRDLEGLPTTTDPAGTERVTTLQAPTTARSPTETPGRRNARAPMNELRPIVIEEVRKGQWG